MKSTKLKEAEKRDRIGETTRTSGTFYVRIGHLPDDERFYKFLNSTPPASLEEIQRDTIRTIGASLADFVTLLYRNFSPAFRTRK